MNRNKIIYSLNVENIQTVALEEIGRELTDKEIQMIIEPIGDYIKWYEAISYAIQDKIKPDIAS
jgi:hypothetical protein